MDRRTLLAAGLSAAAAALDHRSAMAQWVTRDHRWPPRGAWNWALPRELPQLYREFNGIDFGHARLYGALPNLHVGLGTELSTAPRSIEEQTKSGDLSLSPRSTTSIRRR